MILIVMVIALLSLGASGDDSQPRADPVSSTVDLRKCPVLKRGQTDPATGTMCVRELQKRLQSLGYTQKETGTFAELTEANVKAFQRSHNIKQTGIVGSNTLDALLGTPQDTDIPEPQFSADACTSEQCSIYLSRGSTRKYADLVTDRPLATNAVSAAIIRTSCAQLKMLFVAIVCAVVGDHFTAEAKTALLAAAKQRACLRITLARPDLSATPLTFTADKSRRCHS